MSTSGVAALDHSVQETNVWLRAVAEQLHFEDRQRAYNALRAVLHALRDRLPPEVAVHLGAQLPMLVRGLYYEGWHMAGKPTKERSVEDRLDVGAFQHALLKGFANLSGVNRRGRCEQVQVGVKDVDGEACCQRVGVIEGFTHGVG